VVIPVASDPGKRSVRALAEYIRVYFQSGQEILRNGFQDNNYGVEVAAQDHYVRNTFRQERLDAITKVRQRQPIFSLLSSMQMDIGNTAVVRARRPRLHPALERGYEGECHRLHLAAWNTYSTR
jgi:hypothetical protein